MRIEAYPSYRQYGKALRVSFVTTTHIGPSNNHKAEPARKTAPMHGFRHRYLWAGRALPSHFSNSLVRAATYDMYTLRRNKLLADDRSSAHFAGELRCMP